MPVEILSQIKSVVNSALKASLAYKITHKSATESISSNGSMTVSFANSTILGIVTDYEENFKYTGAIPDGAQRVIILSESITYTPKQGDRLAPVQGQFIGHEFIIETVKEDAAGAAYDCMAMPWRS